ncbi:cysteine--tRNA ligase [Methylocystis sp. Sn-Cys]|uniref:cysteine--tRNA ligase n=1 Tax=Methylocystis sp. Sn-Cys TaxID=1701263 RepID=UPI00192348D4|nr:cysteine--tRNA ligase [Methylocystis sp. Sn-Cys]MBL1257254.1 cysteine--tRNA ligase [Methylocystis sp. Sn-Cys]
MSTPALKIYTTLTRTKEAFEPIDRNNVRMYVCGPTVYDYAHIGNARPLIVFDVLYRLLRHLYGESHVKYVRNITDVDDKINARAAQRGITIRELTEETNKVFQEDVRALGCLEPDVQPRATEHIAQMIAIIERLIEAGHAYAADGHVLFDVPSMPAYGRLSRRSLDEMLAGARVDVAPYKRGDMDFVLWKPSKEGEPGWESPWGRGRPGWHIECSAMSWKHLGETFDIHGGGIDLVFPHHENEIAQSCCAFGRDVMANYWMHNGFLQVEGEKMSKSLGNFVTIHELLHTEKFGGRKWPGEVLRLAMLRTHYRQPIDWTVKALEEAEKTLDRWYSALPDSAFEQVEAPDEAFVSDLCDDLNTHQAVTVLHELITDYALQAFEATAGKTADFYYDESKGIALASARLLGLLTHTKVDWFARKQAVGGDVRENIETLISARLAARAAKNWAESDRIRDELAAMGIALKDNKDGTTSWEVKR